MIFKLGKGFNGTRPFRGVTEQMLCINKRRRKEVLSTQKENKIVSGRVFEFFLKEILDNKTKKEDFMNFRRRIV